MCLSENSAISWPCEYYSAQKINIDFVLVPRFLGCFLLIFHRTIRIHAMTWIFFLSPSGLIDDITSRMQNRNRFGKAGYRKGDSWARACLRSSWLVAPGPFFLSLSLFSSLYMRVWLSPREPSFLRVRDDFRFHRASEKKEKKKWKIKNGEFRRR